MPLEVWELAMVARLLDRVSSPSTGWRDLHKARQILRDELNQEHRECSVCEGYGTDAEVEGLDCEACEGLGWVERCRGGVEC